MAYTHTKLERQFTNLAIDTAADAGYFSPGMVPHILRAVAVIITTATTVDATVVTVDHRPTAGSDTARSAAKSTINIPTAAAAGAVYYEDNLDWETAPGEELVIASDGGCTAGDASVVLYLEPRWEVPGNLTNMIATA